MKKLVYSLVFLFALACENTIEPEVCDPQCQQFTEIKIDRWRQSGEGILFVSEELADGGYEETYLYVICGESEAKLFYYSPVFNNEFGSEYIVDCSLSPEFNLSVVQIFVKE